MKLYVSVQVRNEDFDYKAISAAVDGVVIMNYDEHFPGGTPGPVASQDWFTSNLESAIKEIPKEKLICAIGNYGYDWVEKPKKGKLPPVWRIRASPCRKPGLGRAIRKKMSILMATRSTRTSVTRTTITSATMSGFWMR